MRSSLAGVDQPGRPIQGISGREAAEILGLSSEISVCRLVGTGVLTKAKHLGAPSTATRSSGSRCSGTDPVIRTGPRRASAAAILGVSTNRVHQLVHRGFLPAVDHEGRRYFRRQQVEVVANAREARKVTGRIG